MTGDHTVSPGERLEVVAQSASASVFLARVSGDDVRIAVDRDYASDGVLLESGDVANVAVPSGESLVAYGAGSADSTLTLDLLDSQYGGEQLTISLQPRSIVDIEGNVQSDVVDEAGRELGQVRVQDSGGTLVDPATASNVSSVETAVASEQSREVSTWSAGSLETTPGDVGSGARTLVQGESVPDGNFIITSGMDLPGCEKCILWLTADGGPWSIEAELHDESGNVTLEAIVESAASVPYMTSFPIPGSGVEFSIENTSGASRVANLAAKLV